MLLLNLSFTNMYSHLNSRLSSIFANILFSSSLYCLFVIYPTLSLFSLCSIYIILSPKANHLFCMYAIIEHWFANIKSHILPNYSFTIITISDKAERMIPLSLNFLYLGHFQKFGEIVTVTFL